MKHRALIDGVPYETETFPAGPGLEIISDVFALLERDERTFFLGLAMGLNDPDEETRQRAWAVAQEALASETLAEIVGNLCAAAGTRPGGMVGLCRRLLEHTTTTKLRLLPDTEGNAAGSVAEEEAVFNTHFQARYGHLFKVLAWVWRVGFGEPLRGDSPSGSQGGREQEDPTKDSPPSASTP